MGYAHADADDVPTANPKARALSLVPRPQPPPLLYPQASPFPLARPNGLLYGDRPKQQEIARYINAFANSKGGILAFGVTDDHTVQGETFPDSVYPPGLRYRGYG